MEIRLDLPEFINPYKLLHQKYMALMNNCDGDAGRVFPEKELDAGKLLSCRYAFDSEVKRSNCTVLVYAVLFFLTFFKELHENKK